MRTWKLLGIAGLLGAAAVGATVVVVRRRERAWRDVDTDELRRRLHDRLAQAG